MGAWTVFGSVFFVALAATLFPAGVVQASDDRSVCRGEEVAGNYTTYTPWGREFKVRWCVFTHGEYDKIYFEVRAYIDLGKWIGIGWSETPSMVNSDIIVGSTDGGERSFVEDRYVGDIHHIPVYDEYQDVYHYDIYYHDGIMTMKFWIFRYRPHYPEDLDLKSLCLFLIMAWGGDATFGDHDAPTDPFNTLSEYDLLNSHVTPYRVCFPYGCTQASWGGDPHFSILLQDDNLLCYSVQGKVDNVFNLISNDNFLINAKFVLDSKREEVTWMGTIGVIIHKALRHKGSRVTHFKFDADTYKVHIGNEVISVSEVRELISVNGSLHIVKRRWPSKNPAVKVHLKDVGLDFTIKFESSHLDLEWHSTIRDSNTHGLIGQFFREGVEIDEVRKMLVMPNKDPVAVEWKPVWKYLEREKPDDEMKHCWVSMNPGNQGNGLIDGSYMDYVMEDVLSSGFQFQPNANKK